MPVISTNAAANTALLYLNQNSAAESDSLDKLSSGSNFVKASDDAAGEGIATNLQSDITVLGAASTSVSQASSVLNVADGALSNTANILQRMKALVTEGESYSSAGDTNSLSDLSDEYDDLENELNTISSSTSFDGSNVLDGTYDVNYTVGTSSSDTIAVDLSQGVDVKGLGLETADTDTTDFSTATLSTVSTKLDTAIQDVASEQASVGGLESEFSFQSDVINSSVDSLTSAKSAIADTDIASEQTTYTNDEVKTETSIAALASANQMNSALLKLVE